MGPTANVDLVEKRNFNFETKREKKRANMYYLFTCGILFRLPKSSSSRNIFQCISKMSKSLFIYLMSKGLFITRRNK
jgi:hypothetical protein